jgi:hypothetical protein
VTLYNVEPSFFYSTKVHLVDASVYVDASIHVDVSNFSFQEKRKLKTLVTNFGPCFNCERGVFIVLHLSLFSLYNIEPSIRFFAFASFIT